MYSFLESFIFRDFFLVLMKIIQECPFPELKHLESRSGTPACSPASRGVWPGATLFEEEKNMGVVASTGETPPDSTLVYAVKMAKVRESDLLSPPTTMF